MGQTGVPWLTYPPQKGGEVDILQWKLDSRVLPARSFCRDNSTRPVKTSPSPSPHSIAQFSGQHHLCSVSCYYFPWHNHPNSNGDSNSKTAQLHVAQAAFLLTLTPNTNTKHLNYTPSANLHHFSNTSNTSIILHLLIKHFNTFSNFRGICSQHLLKFLCLPKIRKYINIYKSVQQQTTDHASSQGTVHGKADCFQKHGQNYRVSRLPYSFYIGSSFKYNGSHSHADISERDSSDLLGILELYKPSNRICPRHSRLHTSPSQHYPTMPTYDIWNTTPSEFC